MNNGIRELQKQLFAIDDAWWRMVGGHRHDCRCHACANYRKAIVAAMQFDCADLGKQLGSYMKARQLFDRWADNPENCPFIEAETPVLVDRALDFFQEPTWYVSRKTPITLAQTRTVFAAVLKKLKAIAKARSANDPT